MNNRTTIFVGVGITLIGAISLINAVFHINTWDYFWPVVLIALGIVLLLRPKMVPPGNELHFIPISDIHRRGAWQVIPEEIWTFVGDMDLDFTDSEIPLGETRLHVIGIVGDLDVLVPQDVGFKLTSRAIVTDGKAFGDKIETFFSPTQITSSNYDTADRRICMETSCIVLNLKIIQNNFTQP